MADETMVVDVRLQRVEGNIVGGKGNKMSALTIAGTATLVLAATVATSVQSIVRLQREPEGWTVYSRGEVPAVTALQCGNYSSFEWRVVKDPGGQIDVIPFERADVELPFPVPRGLVTIQQGVYGPDGAVRVGDGWLIYYDRGEWGGALLWSDTNGKQWRKLIDTNVAGVVRVGRTYLAFSKSLLMTETGEIYRVEPAPSDGPWEVESIGPLSARPELAISEGTSAVLATTDGITRVFEDGSAENLIRAPFAALFPNSVVCASFRVSEGAQCQCLPSGADLK